jgi:hypothetical protein
VKAKLSGGWRLLIAITGAVVLLGLLSAGVVLSGRSLVIIDNRGETALTLEVVSTVPGDFSWQGDLSAGQRVFRLAKFNASGAVRAVCEDDGGIHRTTGGYVTPGWPHRVDVVAAGCDAVRISAEQLP